MVVSGKATVGPGHANNGQLAVIAGGVREPLGAVGIAGCLHVPKLVAGIVLVGLAIGAACGLALACYAGWVVLLLDAIGADHPVPVVIAVNNCDDPDVADLLGQVNNGAGMPSNPNFQPGLGYRYRDIPILMISSTSDSAERIRGLEMGADDYVVKPFSPRELVSRVRAVLRRSHPTVSSESGQALAFGDLRIDPVTRLVEVDGEERTLAFKLERVEVHAAPADAELDLRSYHRQPETAPRRRDPPERFVRVSADGAGFEVGVVGVALDLDGDAAIEMLTQRIGFVGLTERFDESLVLWKRWTDMPHLDIGYRSINVARSNAVREQILSENLRPLLVAFVVEGLFEGGLQFCDDFLRCSRRRHGADLEGQGELGVTEFRECRSVGEVRDPIAEGRG